MNTIRLNAVSKEYSIHIEKGLFRDMTFLIAKKFKIDRIFIVTDDNVAKIYADTLSGSFLQADITPEIIILKAGEDSKSFESYKALCENLLQKEINRSDTILAFGGGVIGDIAGFTASTLLRGIRLIQIPTSLLAQIDSSIGGKTAINSVFGKNLIGTFYQPEAVYIDPELLNTLPERYYSDGMAEVIKYACIRDEKLFELLEQHDINSIKPFMEEIIGICCSIKAGIVSEDEKDTGERMLLNFGHTLGHVIESYFDYERYTHGEAVALGMLRITQRSEELGFTPEKTSGRIKNLLERYGLPTDFPLMDQEKARQILSKDKKSASDSIDLILLKKIGKAYIHKADMSWCSELVLK